MKADEEDEEGAASQIPSSLTASSVAHDCMLYFLNLCMQTQDSLVEVNLTALSEEKTISTEK